MKTVLLTVLFFPTFAVAQYPENPAPHKFLDRKAIVGFAASTALRSADVAVTCHGFGSGFHEQFLPTQSCRGVTLWLEGSVGAQMGVAYLFHRLHHHRMERVAEYTGALPSVFGLAYSLSSSRKVAPPATTETVVIPGTRDPSFCIVGQPGCH